VTSGENIECHVCLNGNNRFWVNEANGRSCTHDGNYCATVGVVPDQQWEWLLSVTNNGAQCSDVCPPTKSCNIDNQCTGSCSKDACYEKYLTHNSYSLKDLSVVFSCSCLHRVSHLRVPIDKLFLDCRLQTIATIFKMPSLTFSGHVSIPCACFHFGAVSTVLCCCPALWPGWQYRCRFSSISQPDDTITHRAC